MNAGLEEQIVAVCHSKLNMVAHLSSQLLDRCMDKPVVTSIRFPKFYLGSGIYLRFHVYSLRFPDWELQIVLPGGIYNLIRPYKGFGNLSIAQLLSKELGYNPGKILQACKVLDTAARWLEARIEGVQRARQHLLRQQSRGGKNGNDQ